MCRICTKLATFPPLMMITNTKTSPTLGLSVIMSLCIVVWTMRGYQRNCSSSLILRSSSAIQTWERRRLLRYLTLVKSITSIVISQWCWWGETMIEHKAWSIAATSCYYVMIHHWPGLMLQTTSRFWAWLTDQRLQHRKWFLMMIVWTWG